jgi:hypothetical protein
MSSHALIKTSTERALTKVLAERRRVTMIDERSGAEASPKPVGRAKFLYYWFAAAPPAEFANWVRQDIQTDGWLWRRVGQSAIGIAIGFTIANVLLDASRWTLVGMAIGVGIVSVLELTVLASWSRKRALRYYEKRWSRN